MASRMQVKNGKAFDFDKMVINWDGSQYPFRELSFTNAPFYTFVSIVALERKLLNFYGEPVNSMAEWIDNQISYSVISKMDTTALGWKEITHFPRPAVYV